MCDGCCVSCDRLMFDAVSGRDHMSRTLKQEQITHDHRNFPLFKGWQEQVNPEILQGVQ